jgi:hypothetical protein
MEESPIEISKAVLLITHPDGSRSLAIEPSVQGLGTEDGLADAVMLLDIYLNRLALLREQLVASSEAIRAHFAEDFTAVNVVPVSYAKKRALSVVLSDGAIIFLLYAVLQTTSVAGGPFGAPDGQTTAILVTLAIQMVLGVMGILRWQRMFTVYLFLLVISIFFHVSLVTVSVEHGIPGRGSFLA